MFQHCCFVIASDKARFPLGEFVRANRQESRNASYLFAANFGNRLVENGLKSRVLMSAKVLGEGVSIWLSPTYIVWSPVHPVCYPMIATGRSLN